MYHEDFLPSTSLKTYIRNYFFISVKYGKFHFPADGCPGLIINLGDPFLLGFEQGHLTKFAGCRLFGSSTRNLLTKHMMGQTDLLAVKFNPGQLPRFFNVPAIELTDTSASIHTLLGRFGKEMEQKFYETKNVSKTIKLLDNIFIKLLSRECKYFTGQSPFSYLKDRSSLEHEVMGSTYIMSHFFNTYGGSSAINPQT
jgi:hypothetical protein